MCAKFQNSSVFGSSHQSLQSQCNVVWKGKEMLSLGYELTTSHCCNGLALVIISGKFSIFPYLFFSCFVYESLASDEKIVVKISIGLI